MRWTIETERKNDEFRLSLSLSHTCTRAHTHARALSLSVFLKKIASNKSVKFYVNETRKGGNVKRVANHLYVPVPLYHTSTW